MAADQHSGAEEKENPKGFDLKNRDIGHDKWNQGVKIAERTRPFHSVKAIAIFGDALQSVRI